MIPGHSENFNATFKRVSPWVMFFLCFFIPSVLAAVWWIYLRNAVAEEVVALIGVGWQMVSMVKFHFPITYKLTKQRCPSN